MGGGAEAAPTNATCPPAAGAKGLRPGKGRALAALRRTAGGGATCPAWCGRHGRRAGGPRPGRWGRPAGTPHGCGGCTPGEEGRRGAKPKKGEIENKAAVSWVGSRVPGKAAQRWRGCSAGHQGTGAGGRSGQLRSEAARADAKRQPAGRQPAGQPRLALRRRVPAHLLLGKAGVDHVHDAVDGERRLGDVGGHDDLAAGRAAGARRRGRGVEDALLLLGRQRGVERVHLDGAHAVAQVVHLHEGWGGLR